MRRAALLGVLLLAAPASGRAQVLIDYEVRPGDRCEGIARRLYGDAEDAIERVHAHNPQLGPTPHHLVPGTILRVPAPPPPAHLSAVHRTVERRAPDASAFRPAPRGAALARGTQVRTHEASSAEITFSDESHVTVRERTLVIVYGGRERLTQRPVTRAELERGALRSRLGELAGRQPLEIETPSSTASLDGDAVVSVEDDGTSRVANHGRREATVVAGGERLRLPAGTGTVVRRGERAARPRRLLAAPRWRADRSGVVVGLVAAGATLSGGFEPVEGAARYRVEVARTPEGGELLRTLELGGDARRFEADGLPEGTVYVSVASIDDAGLEGRRSPWRAFGVRLARLVAPGGGAAAPHAVWPGTWLVPPRGFDCAIEGEPPDGLVTLRAPGSVAIACADRGGNVAAPLVVQVLEPSVRVEGTPTRDRTVPMRLSLGAGDPPRAATLAIAVDGARVSRVRDAEGGVVFDLWTPPDAPAELALRVAVAGAGGVPLGDRALPVVDPSGTGAAAPGTPAREDEPEDGSPAARAPRPAQGAFGDLLWPSALGLRDERVGGVGGWIGIAPIEAGPEPQLRVFAGARAQLPEVPIRVGFASQLDVLARPAAPGRRGDADLVASAGARLLDEGMLGLALDLSVWIPTRSEPESLGRVRLVPTLEGSARPLEWLAVRTRQGAIVDASEAGARLWAFALGLDVSPLEWLALGVELDGSVGDFADRSGAALALGGGLEARWELLSVAAGARFGLTDEGRALLGDWAATLSVRVLSR